VSDAAISYRLSPFVSTGELNELFSAAWEGHEPHDFDPVLRRSLTYVCAYHRKTLAGFVNVAWDGGRHAFLLDTTVRPDLRLRGIGRELVRQAAAEARKRGVEWLHVDFEPDLRPFYDTCGFRATDAGLMRLAAEPA
jgi:GNAT superfamily N-acetyltransferase